jgi:uncharacterized protein
MMLFRKVLPLILLTSLTVLLSSRLASATELKKEGSPMPLPVSVGKSTRQTLYTVRLSPGQDLQKSLTAFVKEKNLKAVSILTGVGSLTDATIRYANQPNGTKLTGHFEIVSLVGTLSSKSGSHIHLSVSDETGKTLGGHLLEGSKVYTTVEITLLEQEDLEYAREKDPISTYNELVVYPRTEK